jgi:hypothetical protein
MGCALMILLGGECFHFRVPLSDLDVAWEKRFQVSRDVDLSMCCDRGDAHDGNLRRRW